MNKFVPCVFAASVCLVGCAAERAQTRPNDVAQSVQDEPEAIGCVDTEGGRSRREAVLTQLLPNVVFEGETQSTDLVARMAAHRVPAVSVAVIRDGTIDWSAAFGSARPDATPVGCAHVFQAGSIAKPVTVLAALRMAAQGLIDLDADIEHSLERFHLPEGQQSTAHPVTLRNLFMHTAGVTPGGYEGYARGDVLPSDVQTLRGEAPSNARKIEVLATPDAALVYSGAGYTLAEVALEDLFDQPFDRLMRDWILKPAGMTHAEFAVPLPETRWDEVAHGFDATGNEIAGGWRVHPEQAAAGLWATATDLAHWLIEMHRGQRGDSAVFSTGSMRELMARPFDGHAYGFRLVGEGDQVFLTHNGGTVGYRASVILNLASGDGAVFLSNSDNGIDLAREFFAALARAYDWPVFRERRVTRRPVRLEELAALTGDYVFDEQGWKVSVTIDGGALTLVFPNGDRYAMSAIVGDGLDFIHAATGVQTRFGGDDRHREIQLYEQTGRRIATK